MHIGKTVFAQLMTFMPEYEFQKCVDHYKGDYRVRKFTCREHFLVMSFAQLTGRESLRDIENCLPAFSGKLYHSGMSNPVSKSTLADANEKRDWRIYADFAQVLIKQARFTQICICLYPFKLLQIKSKILHGFTWYCRNFARKLEPLFYYELET